MIMFFQRVKNFILRVRWLARFMHVGAFAPFYLAIRRIYPNIKVKGHFKGSDFTFRGHDLSAVREVLHDQEYAFLDEYIRSIKAPNIIDVGAHIGLFSM